MTVRELFRELGKHMNDNGSSSIAIVAKPGEKAAACPAILVADQPVYVNDQGSTWERVYGVHFEKGLGCVLEIASRTAVSD